MRLIEQRQGVTTEGKGARENLHQRGIKHGMKPEPQETRPAGLGHNKARHPLHKQRLDLQFDVHNWRSLDDYCTNKVFFVLTEKGKEQLQQFPQEQGRRVNEGSNIPHPRQGQSVNDKCTASKGRDTLALGREGDLNWSDTRPPINIFKVAWSKRSPENINFGRRDKYRGERENLDQQSRQLPHPRNKNQNYRGQGEKEEVNFGRRPIKNNRQVRAVGASYWH